MAGAVLGGYGLLIGLAVLRSKFKSTAPEPAAAPVAAASSPAGDDLIPALDSTDFEAFVNSEIRLAKFVGSEDSLMKWVDSLGKE